MNLATSTRVSRPTVGMLLDLCHADRVIVGPCLSRPPLDESGRVTASFQARAR